ncbi:serine hydrolase domain-containing protein [Algoriphagus zhangzhouensis]|uniref:CubicO group peptidase, beta-lactamase class C family n=1 Tax=Algoriphagus zhangzhouensis TaxID=1073327 RepID=A0A1M7Z3T2_9BACT|nr:serine hydrolase domain-containing protein [Algoriphagus zhangzhouensis]TDY48448.1 CubicO group peptidase (beta-lactamase class C family) [Algoriphagus zhangzhouensis]SHO59495.1 CubicO group peptidase, beta-lactamase class C family [Algoriphagus zhangzhouensis]
MKNLKTTIFRMGFAFGLTLISGMSYSQDNPLAKYLEVPGAKVTLPINFAKSPFSLEFSQQALKSFENFHYQMGGDHAVYYNLHLSEMLPTATSKPNELYRPLDKSLNAEIGNKVTFPVKEGELTVNEYVVHPNHRVQGALMIHKGKIVYEAYPGMNPMDMHAWMSPGKTTVGLVIAQLEAEGKVDMQKEVVDYIPEFKGTNWDGIKMIDAANMATGLQLEETLDAIINPSSIIVKFFSAEFGTANPETGKVDDWLDILKDAEKIEGEKPGEVFRYSSAVTQIFVVIAERIENKTWAKLFEERVWGKMTARLDMQHHLTPDGTSVAHGLISTTLEDFGRFGMLFTPSWEKAAVTPVVSAEVLKRLQTGGSVEAFRRGAKFKGLTEEFQEEPLMNSFQFDAVFSDGALYKHGNVGQGIYIDPERDFVGVYFSTNGYIPPYGEDKMMGYLRRSAKYLAGQ